MKYLFTLDFKEVLRHKWLIFGFYGIVILFLIFNNYIGSFNDNDIYMIFITIGGYQKVTHPILLIYTLLIFSFYAYMALVIFIKDFALSSNIFLRISRARWFKYKILNILLIIFIFEFILFILVFWFFEINVDILIMFNILLVDFMTKMIFILVTFILYIMFNYYGYLINLFIVLISCTNYLVSSCYFSVNYYNNELYLFNYLIILYFINRYIFIKLNNVLFERSM